MNRVLELTHELQSCAGFAITVEIRSLGIAWTINEQNFQELIAALLGHESRVAEGSSSCLSTSPESEAEIINVMRLVHNYLASSRSELEHTRRIVTALCSSMDFRGEYQTKVDATFTENPLARFVQDLRNFTLHRCIPLRGPSVAFEFDGTLTGYYKLDREELLSWKNWHRLSQTFMESIQGHLLVYDIVDQYHQLLSQFQNWLGDALRAQFFSELEHEEELRNAILQESRRVRSEEA